MISDQSLASPSDESLARQAQAGSLASFEELVRRHEAAIYRYLAARTGNRHDAEDLTQQVFVRAWQRIRRYHPGRPFAPWLYTLARHAGVGYFRTMARRPVLVSEDAVEFADPGLPPDHIAARNEGSPVWKQAREHLPERQFTALWLMYAEEKSVREVAACMGLFQPHVKVLLYRARQSLRAHLTPGKAPDRWAGVPAAGRQRGVTS